MTEILSFPSWVIPFLTVNLVGIVTMTASSGQRPPFENDVEAIVYFEEHEIAYSLDESGRHVEQVTLGDDETAGDLLERLQKLKHLRMLAFNESTAKVDHLRTVAVRYPKIDLICIEDTGHVAVAVYEELREVEGLRSFARNCPLIIDPTNVPQVVSKHPPDPNGSTKMSAIFALEWLESLNLKSMTLGGVDFIPIERLRNLETLTLDETELSDEQLHHIGKLTKLKWLQVGRTKVTDKGIKHLDNLHELEYLGASENRGITDNSAHSLLQLRRLENLEIMDTEIGDGALRTLAKHPSLKKLSISGTWITDEGLVALAELTTLEMVNVEATKVSQAGVDRFRRALPKCRVVTNPPEYMGWDRTQL